MARFLRRGAFVAFLAFVALFCALKVPQAWSALHVKNERIRTLQREVADLTRENKERKDRIHDLQYDRNTQENLIKDRLKKQHKGDTTLMLPEAKQ